MQQHPPEFAELERRLGHDWQDCSLLREALTHSSYGNANSVPHNERLEFLGDSVLDLVSAEWLMAEYPAKREGFMSQRRSELVRTCALAERARALGVGEALLVGHGSDYIRGVESVLADAMEAVVGALYRDCGSIAVVRECVLRWGILHV